MAGELQIKMIAHIEEMVDTFPHELDKSAATPATESLFIAREEAEKLDSNRGEVFHTFTTKG